MGAELEILDDLPYSTFRLSGIRLVDFGGRLLQVAILSHLNVKILYPLNMEIKKSKTERNHKRGMEI